MKIDIIERSRHWECDNLNAFVLDYFKTLSESDMSAIDWKDWRLTATYMDNYRHSFNILEALQVLDGDDLGDAFFLSSKIGLEKICGKIGCSAWTDEDIEKICFHDDKNISSELKEHVINDICNFWFYGLKKRFFISKFSKAKVLKKIKDSKESLK